MSITPINGGSGRIAHNYYAPDDFFRWSPEEGAIHLRDGQRALAVSEDFVAGLHQGLDDELGGASGLVMYRCGLEWAQQDMKRFARRMRHEFGGGRTDIWNMNMRFVFETWWWPLTSSGWGAWSLDLGFLDQGMVMVEIRDSAVARSMRRVGKPVCHLYAGLLAGAFAYWEKEERQGIEAQCYSMGNDCCKFLIGDERMANAAEFWREEGASAAEIVENLL